MTRPVRRRHAVAVVVAVLAAGLAGIAHETGALGSLERATISARFAARHTPRPAGITIVKIDDRTFGDLGIRWPFPRGLHGRLIDRLHAAGAKEIVYDVQFTEQTTGSQDLALYRAIGAAGGATLATSESDAQGRTNVLGGDANLAKVNARAAAANLETSAGGIVTRYPRAVAGLPSVAAVAAQRATGRTLPRSRSHGGSAWIDYRGGTGTFPAVSFSDVLAGRVSPSLFRDKVVIVGATAPSLQDLHATPTSGSALMSGAEVEANAIWTAIHGNPLRSGPGWLTVLAIVLLALLPPLASLRLGVARAALAAIAAGAAAIVGAQVAFNAGVIVTLIAPLAALGLGTVGMLAASYRAASVDGRLLGWVARRRSEQLHDAQIEIITRLAQAADARDSDTGRHTERIGRLCERVALELGLDPARAQMLRLASAMHDIGKIGIPDHVLLKPGRLDAAEWQIMRTHTTLGAEILSGSSSPLIQLAETIARTHHERWDGSGYPSGLAGEEIPLESRICSICDVFDALLSKRPYKDAWPASESIAEIARVGGSQFDPAVVAAFFTVAETFDDAAEPARTRELDLASLPPLAEIVTREPFAA